LVARRSIAPEYAIGGFSMDHGVTMFAADYAIRPDELAQLLEEHGFESMWLPEHTHIPASRKTPWPGGADLPKEYWHTYDPFVSLGAAAVVTTKLKLATGICLVMERDPITLAKEVASVDLLSNGRFILGIGGGWNAEEMENHGTPYRKRWRILRENILAMKEIWTKEEGEFHGDFVNFDKVWSHPKPVQKPHPPILMGGDGPRTFDRVIEFCDGWMPIYGRSTPGTGLLNKIATLKQQAKNAGRNPDSINITIFGAPTDRDGLDQFAQAGVNRVVFWLPPADRETVEPMIERYTKLIA
jgi:probable F420-dependent oxidoreductase